MSDGIEAISSAVGSVQEARWIIEESRGDAAVAERLAARRASGEPLQHVLGHWGFRTLDVLTDARGLIPRPETEIVVEVALGEVPATGPVLAADLGTGSGVIACSLAVEMGARARVLAVDASADAVALATQNLERTLGETDQVSVVCGSWYKALPTELEGQFHLIVSNPPYLAEAEWEELDPVVRDFDPYAALVAGPTGLEDLEVVIGLAPRWLKEGGSLVVEIAPHQADEARALAAAAGFACVSVRPDLQGRERVLVARR